ncbi:MAG: carbamoyltransferase HypF [Bacteroidales bacterium]|nr:carbamoyltransferase HypF [Bacteroidales bacterium]
MFNCAIIKKSVSISVKGLVQGVGFRPFVYRLAQKYNLKGDVANRTDGVVVNVCGDEKDIEYFKVDILKLAPPVASIKNINSVFVNDLNPSDFSILPSETINNLITEISPDIAVCDECIHDMGNQKHRISYSFINCTNCGPRFSIINKLPYDRINTTMHEFEMCKNCETEYHNVSDRRFHAQPVACNYCGPKYLYNDEQDFAKIIDNIASKIDRGEVVAVKGLGGYNLICDARNNSSVLRLREIKGRDAKPFAVMFRDIETLKEYCVLNIAEKELAESWRRPIIILDQKKELCYSVNNDLNSIGALLPYLPFHYLLFEKLLVPAIIYTSANNSDEPIISDDTFAKDNLNDKVDAFISHNRRIQNPVDDSVVKIVDSRQQIIRRARGFVPNPIHTLKSVDGIFAAGAELKNSFCIGKNNNAILSQYIGDLKNFETFKFYKNTVNQFFDLFKFSPKIVACDLHPEYLSTKFAESFNVNSLNGCQIPLIKVQHHHAHIVSCMAEYQINEKVIGVCFDGTGYGTDGNIWGGEFLICDTKTFERYAHFDYVKMPGGDLAVEEPWRMALAYLNNYSVDKIENLDCFKNIGENEIEIVKKMIDKNINSPLTSSAGRLFDVIACLLNLCSKQSFDAEGPMRLEAIVDKTEKSYYPFEIVNGIVRFEKMLNSILNDISKRSASIISAKFHNTIVNIINDVVCQIKKDTGINKIVLSGGVFQNRFLLEKLIQILANNNFEVYTNHLIPPNDGGIALGQLVVASNYI